MTIIHRLSVLLLCLCLALPVLAIAQDQPIPDDTISAEAPMAPDVEPPAEPVAEPAVESTPPEAAVEVEAVPEIPAVDATPEAEAAPLPEPEPTLEAAPEVPAEPPAAVETTKAPRFVVILPERIDNIWFWFYYTDESEHVVQSSVEKALVRAGIDVVDISAANVFGDGTIEGLLGKDTAVAKARQLGADYVILGSATASKSSESVAYNVTVIRANASVTAKIVRVSDGKIMNVVDATAMEGGQAVMAAGREALKKAGKSIGDQLVGAISSLTP